MPRIIVKKSTAYASENNTMLDANLASGSSRVSRFSQSVDMILSYLFGYFRKISCNIATINLTY